MPKSARQKARKNERNRTARKLKRTEQALLELTEKMSNSGLKLSSDDPVVSQDKTTKLTLESVASTDAIDKILGPMPSVITGAKEQSKDTSAEELFGGNDRAAIADLPETASVVTFAADTHLSDSDTGHSHDEPSETPGKFGTPVTSSSVIDIISSLQSQLQSSQILLPN